MTLKVAVAISHCQCNRNPPVKATDLYTALYLKGLVRLLYKQLWKEGNHLCIVCPTGCHTVKACQTDTEAELLSKSKIVKGIHL